METHEIKNSTFISDIIGRYIALKRNGSNHVGLCPFHEERTPSMQVSDAKGIFKCFGCGEGGDAIDFVQKIEQIGFKDAVTIINGGEATNNYRPLPRKPEMPVFSIPEARLLNAYNQDFTGSTLYLFFTGLFPQHVEIVNRVFADYRVMAGSNGLNVFPNIDIKGSIRQVKEITADPVNGKRSHTTNPRINGISLLSPEEQESYRLRQVFFGEHLIDYYPNRKIILVESEKTTLGMAIVEAIYNPNDCRLWIATGGKNGVKMNNKQAIAPLRGRDVYLMPDNDAVNDWQDYVTPINEIANCYFIDEIARKENAENKAKYDILDYTLEEIKAAPNKGSTIPQPDPHPEPEPIQSLPGYDLLGEDPRLEWCVNDEPVPYRYAPDCWYSCEETNTVLDWVKGKRTADQVPYNLLPPVTQRAYPHLKPELIIFKN